ncbi:MAG: DUF4190 domain-containing protein [Ruminococcaceae bacterium]|nr:DUF4190 domain-containing protein [Oscillospiraceae bacterium]
MNQQQTNYGNSYGDSVKPNNLHENSRGLAIAALVLGIIGTCISFIPIVNNAAFVLGILAVVLGSVSIFKRLEKKMAIASVILGILAVVITLIMQSVVSNAIDDAVDDFNDEIDYMTGAKTKEVLSKYLNVSFGKFTVVEGEYYDECKLEVVLKNKGSEAASFDVEIEAVDRNGNRIDVDSIYVSNLGAGQSYKYDIFTFVSSDKYERLKQATFRVIEASKY